MHSRTSLAAALAAVASLIASGSAHSWVEQLQVTSQNGSFTGAPGFARGNVLRTGGTNVDKGMVYLLPPNGRDPTQGILPSDTVCFPDHQQEAKQTDGSPRLQAAPGDMVTLRYQENGHVTLPENQPGKPPNRGTIFVYGTTQSAPDDKLLDVTQWNADGSAGNKKGKLLGTYNYDDSQCYQVNGGPISAQRQKQFPHTADKLMGGDLWCSNAVALPKDTASGKPYTLYWVWNWPTAVGTPGQPQGKNEVYTTCMDIDIQGSASAPAPNKVVVAHDAETVNVGSSAVPGQLQAIKDGKPFNAPADFQLIGQKSQASGQAGSSPAASAAPEASPSPQAPAAPAASASPPTQAAPQASAAPPAPASPQASAPPAAAPPAAAPQASAPPAAAPPASAPPAAAAPPASAAAPATITVTASAPAQTITVISTVGSPSPQSTTVTTVPKSTQTVPNPTAGSTEPGVPTVTLPSVFSGTATPVVSGTATATATTSKPCKQKRSRVFDKAWSG